MRESSHISWWSNNNEPTLKMNLAALGLVIEELPSQEWDSENAPFTINSVRDINLCLFAPRDDDWSFLLLHLFSKLGRSIALKLSELSDRPAVVFEEYDQLAWGFLVYKEGKFLGAFCNRPEVVGAKPASCMISSEVIAETFSVESKAIAPYLRHLSANEKSRKAFDDDDFALDNHWVRCDFMKRLGMYYHDHHNESGTRHIIIREPGIND